MNVIRFLPALLVTTTFCVAAEPATPEQIATDLVAQFDRLVPVVERVKDKASAEKATAELDDIAQKIMAIGLRAKGMKATEAEKKKMTTRLAESQKELQAKFPPALEKAKAAGPEASEILHKGLISWAEAMQKFGKALAESGV